MSIFIATERPLAEALAQLLNTNPFFPEWVERERAILGQRFETGPPVYSRQALWPEEHLHANVHPNVQAVWEQVAELVEKARGRLETSRASDKDLALYEDLALFYLYGPYGEHLTTFACGAWKSDAAEAQQDEGVFLKELWNRFTASFERYFPEERSFPSAHQPERVFAIFFQMRRAFGQIYDHIIGGSKPAARLRAAIWQSIFTHDLHRYHRSLHARLRDFPTLITGASGTGKELVARAIARSQYIPFDAKNKRFDADFNRLFFPLNLSALAPTLVESELFGHIKGAFTGAVRDRQGWLELCDKRGAVFLDEIGEVDPAIQVKLLRVLQTREFQPLGDSGRRQFEGKLLAATNRDLAAEIQTGRFRHDFYYRLCADQITTPTLREQLEDHPDDLNNLVLFITREVLGDAECTSGEAESLAREVVRWIETNLKANYPWPGNFRELGHCVRSVIIRRDYTPLQLESKGDEGPAQCLAREVAAGTLSAAELERRYFALVYAQTGGYQSAADRLKTDWRTVKSKVERSEW